VTEGQRVLSLSSEQERPRWRYSNIMLVETPRPSACGKCSLTTAESLASGRETDAAVARAAAILAGIRAMFSAEEAHAGADTKLYAAALCECGPAAPFAKGFRAAYVICVRDLPCLVIRL
jgi:hypothetical protein